jgi:hypothetical protein
LAFEPGAQKQGEWMKDETAVVIYDAVAEAVGPTAYPCPFCTARIIPVDTDPWDTPEGGPYPVWCDICGIAALSHLEGQTPSLRKPTDEEIEEMKVRDPDLYEQFKWEFI